MRYILKNYLIFPASSSVAQTSRSEAGNVFQTDLDSELMLFNEEANEVIVYVLA